MDAEPAASARRTKPIDANDIAPVRSRTTARGRSTRTETGTP
jgi:hypothetical protein